MTLTRATSDRRLQPRGSRTVIDGGGTVVRRPTIASESVTAATGLAVGRPLDYVFPGALQSPPTPLMRLRAYTRVACCLCRGTLGCEPGIVNMHTGAPRAMRRCQMLLCGCVRSVAGGERRARRRARAGPLASRRCG